MKNIVIVSFSIIAAVIGAGFASGQEILCYFSVFGKYGLAGIIVNTSVFVGFIFFVTDTAIKKNLNTYDDFLSVFRSSVMRRSVKVLTLTFSLAVFGTMISALAQIIYTMSGFPLRFSALFSAIISAVVLFKGSDKVFTFNGILGIILVFLIIFCVLYMTWYREFHAFSTLSVKAVGNGLIYSGYNLISLTPVIISLSKRLTSRTDAASVSVVTGALLAIIMLLSFSLLAIYHNRIELGELPMLTLAKRQNGNFALLYTFVLSCAVVTTLLASGGGLVDALCIKNKPLYILLLCALAYFLSGLGFKNLINNAYRLCGIAGFFVCVSTITACIRYSKSSVSKQE